jgi:glycerophosphoryl diester phosphodiesterase
MAGSLPLVAPFVLAHRGAHEHVPENTLEAFAAAVALGADGVETDIRVDREGVPILFHDRLAPNGNAVSALTRAELAALVGYPVPTLVEALDWGQQLIWDLEVKAPAAVDAMAAILPRYAERRRLILTSFWHPVAYELCHRLGLPGGLVVAHCPFERTAARAWLPDSPWVRTMVWDFDSVDSEVLECTARANLDSFVYGAESAEELRQLVEWPVRGIITDFPERVRR